MLNADGRGHSPTWPFMGGAGLCRAEEQKWLGKQAMPMGMPSVLLGHRLPWLGGPGCCPSFPCAVPSGGGETSLGS